ncbi:MAG: succinate dehydrogenase cytochrome b subunit [Nitrospirota bacterium]
MLPTSSVGRKLVMAATGQLMVLFIILHVLGNATIYFGLLNAYAAHLHALPPLVWSFRLGLIILFSFHIFYGIALTLENNAAKPQSYVMRNDLSATFAGRNMVWTGAVIGSFLIYHLLHFTVQVTNPALAAAKHMDTLGRPDVVRMVIKSFQDLGIASVYLLSMTALWLHLSHGIQSSFQTWGLNSEQSLPIIKRAGAFAAIVLFLAYIAVPVLIAMKIVR